MHPMHRPQSSHTSSASTSQNSVPSAQTTRQTVASQFDAGANCPQTTATSDHEAPKTAHSFPPGRQFYSVDPETSTRAGTDSVVPAAPTGHSLQPLQLARVSESSHQQRTHQTTRWSAESSSGPALVYLVPSPFTPLLVYPGLMR